MYIVRTAKIIKLHVVHNMYVKSLHASRSIYSVPVCKP